MHTRVVSPIEALRIVTDRCQGPDPECIPVQSARHHFLADGIRIAPGVQNGPMRVASTNGYGLPKAFRGGVLRLVSRRLEAEEAGTLGDFSDAVEKDTKFESLPTVVRLETGDPVSSEVDRLLPISSACVVGRNLLSVRPADVPAPGFGITPAIGVTEVQAGTHLSARLQAALLANGVREVRVRPPWTVGLASIGGELVDLLSLDVLRHEDRSREDDRTDQDVEPLTGDVTGLWLPDSIAGLGLEPQSFGSIDDEPATLRQLLHRAERRQLQTCVFSGGLGDGIDDRTIEALRLSSYHIHFEALDLEPGRRLLFAQGHGFDVFVLGGRPLDAAIGFDLIVRPALLKALGAASGVWDWSRRTGLETNHENSLGVAQLSQRASAAVSPSCWHVAPRGHWLHEERRKSLHGDVGNPFSPWISGQIDWVLESPADNDPPRRYSVPCGEMVAQAPFWVPRKTENSRHQGL